MICWCSSKVMARLSLNRTAGHWRLGMSGHGSQFMSTQKLCKRRRKTLVDTVPVCSTFKSNSPGVSSSLLLSFLESVPEVSARLKESNTKDCKFEDVVKSAEKAAVLVLVY
jgi:hypothetical protein